jgi:hypothetical protein
MATKMSRTGYSATILLKWILLGLLEYAFDARSAVEDVVGWVDEGGVQYGHGCWILPIHWSAELHGVFLRQLLPYSDDSTLQIDEADDAEDSADGSADEDVG